MPTDEQEKLARDIERLVDGELDEPARRHLLEQLDRQPQGWRRCALAFLEDQCWREAVGPALDPAIASRADAPQHVRSPRIAAAHRGGSIARTSVRSTANFLALAASLLIAFGLGWSLARPRGEVHRQPLSVAQKHQAPQAAPSSGADHRSQPTPASDALAATVENNDSHPDSPRPNHAAEIDNLPAQPADPSGAGTSIGPNMWVVDPSSDLAAQLFEAIQRTGHRVERRREWWPADFADGRLGVVPVERVEIRLIDDVVQ